MNKTELVAKAKLRLRKMSADTLDEDVEQLINVALADLKRIGVHSSYLDPENIKDPLIIEAALVYAKANFGNPENHGELMAAYDMICTKIKGGGYHRSNSDTVSQKKSNGIPGKRGIRRNQPGRPRRVYGSRAKRL